jgi:cytochrome c
MPRTLYAVVFFLGLSFGAACVAASTGAGQEAFEKRCTGCHGVDTSREGPALRGVFGRAAGKRPGFLYSDALKAANFTWDQSTLDRWLTNPDALVPGTDMAFRLNDETERAKIIAYLKEIR